MNALKDVEYGFVVQGEGGAKFGLPLQNVSWWLAVKPFDLFYDSMEVVSVVIVRGNASSRSVITTEGIYYCRLPVNIQENILWVWSSDAHYVYAAAGAGPARRNL